MVSNTDSFNLKVLYQSLKFQYCDNILCVINVNETRKSLWNILAGPVKNVKVKKNNNNKLMDWAKKCIKFCIWFDVEIIYKMNILLPKTANVTFK